MSEFSAFVEEDDSYLYEATMKKDGEEVATTIAGYIGKQLVKRSKCKDCKTALVLPKDTSSFDNTYFYQLSRGGLTVPSPSLAEFVVSSFAILDSVDEKIMKFPLIPCRHAAEFVLRKYSQPVRFTCDYHRKWGIQFAIKPIVNIFYNNKQKLSADLVRKDSISGFKKRQREKSCQKTGLPTNIMRLFVAEFMSYWFTNVANLLYSSRVTGLHIYKLYVADLNHRV